MYWCAMSTPNADQQLMKAKWMSLVNHIHNKHTHDGIYKKCSHGTLSRHRKTKWLKPSKYFNYILAHCLLITDTKASKKITDLILNTKFCNDISCMSPMHQTSCLEAFHSVLIHFLPKSTAFSYKRMLGRYTIHVKHVIFMHIMLLG